MQLETAAAIPTGAGAAEGEANPLRGAWFPAVRPIKGVALVVHGLNLKPGKMDDLSRVLAGAGITAFRIELAGHGYDSSAKASASRWIDEMSAAYRAAAREAARCSAPLVLVGYSLGGLLGETIMNLGPSEQRARFDRAVLIAPAIAPRTMTRFIRPLFLLGGELTLPSRNLPEYRARAGTPIAAYKAMFDVLAMLRKTAYRRSNISTLVLSRKGDELVSLSGLRRLQEKRGLTNWTLLEIAAAPRGIPRHLAVDPRSLGATSWPQMTETILRFLRS